MDKKDKPAATKIYNQDDLIDWSNLSRFLSDNNKRGVIRRTRITKTFKKPVQELQAMIRDWMDKQNRENKEQ